MAPTLTDVLSSGAGAPSFNPLYLLLGLAAGLAAAVTMVRGREVFRRHPGLPAVVDAKPCLEDLHHREKIEKLNFMVNELKYEREKLAASNAELLARLAAESRLQAGAETAERPPLEEKKAEKQKAKTKVKAKAKAKKETDRKPRRVSRKGK